MYKVITQYTIRGKEVISMGAIVAISRGRLENTQDFSQDLFTRWELFIDAAPKTIDTYRRNIRQFINYLQTNNITRPAREDIIAFRDSIALNHRPSTVQNYLAAVKQFFRWTAQEGLYPNIADHVKGVKLDKGFKKDYLTSTQAGKLLADIDRSTLKGLRDYAIISLMITTGLRTIEVQRANIEDLRTVADFTALFVQGKGHTERGEYVKVIAPVESAIRDYLKARGKAKDNQPLFACISNKNAGGRMTTRSISRIAKDCLLGSGFNSSRLTAHSLRHTAATLNLLNGATPEETQQLLRHTNINTTLIYSHALDRASNKSEDRIGRAIFG